MKKILLILAVLSLLAVGQLAQATYLDSRWYAQLSNVQTTGPYGLGRGMLESSTNIKVSYTNSTTIFDVLQSGQSTAGEEASWWNMTLAPENLMGSISFDFTTYWTQPNLILQLSTISLNPYDPSHIIWSSSLTGLCTNHITVNANPNGYRFDLVVLPQVPEPGSLLALGSLCAAGLLGYRRIKK